MILTQETFNKLKRETKLIEDFEVESKMLHR